MANVRMEQLMALEGEKIKGLIQSQIDKKFIKRSQECEDAILTEEEIKKLREIYKNSDT